MPFYTDVPKLHDLGIRAVVNTCDEYAGPNATYVELGISQLRVPVVDYCSPTVAQVDEAVKFMEAAVTRGEKVYVHCKGIHFSQFVFILHSKERRERTEYDNSFGILDEATIAQSSGSS